MRRRFWIPAMVLLCLLFCFPMRCRSVDVTQAQWDSIDTRALEEAASDSGMELRLDEEFTLNSGLAGLKEQLLSQLETALKRAARTALVLLLAVLFSEIAGTLGVFVRSGDSAATLVGVAAVTAVSAADVTSLMGLGRQAVDNIWTFSNLLIPVMTACSAAGGSLTGSTARQVATFIFADLLVTLMDKLLIPMMYLYTAACAASAAVENRGLDEIAKTLKWSVTTVLTTLLLAFTGYLSLTSAAAAGIDAVKLRLTRTVISSMIPVVGGILSNATETVLSGVGVLKSAVGSFGAVVVIGICITSFLRLGVQYLMYRLAAVLAAVLSGSRVARLIGDIASAFALMLSMTGTAALLVMISIFATLAVATG